LQQRLPATALTPQRLHEALRYSVLAPGKRVRPMLVYATAAALDIAESRVDGAACAIELIHAYSLVHDDLPAMDDDDLRRGRPTCHKAFDEATAILVGDALQVLAFQILARDAGLPADPAIRLQLIDILAVASGTSGMAGGQALDLAAQGRMLSIAEVEDMHARKTGALIRASVMMSAACAAGLTSEIRGALDDYARDLGLAFQIQDDLLDIEGDPALLGKSTGADQAHRKPTYPAITGVEMARAKVRELHHAALNSLTVLGTCAEPLVELSHWLLHRKY
jgi:geranylgeranyl pyrophosphate synthase